MSLNRLKRRALRANEQSDLGEILQEYGYLVMPDPHREQQFACDLHGPDNKPSARFYGSTNSFHCFACAKSRDPIEFIKDKEQVGFKQAIEILEKRLKLPPLPWEDDDDESDPRDETEREIDQIANATSSYEDDQTRLKSFLDGLTQDRDLDANSLLKFWEAYDRIDYHVREDQWNTDKGKVALRSLHAQVMEHLKEAG